MKKHITTLKKVAVPANLTEVFALVAVIGGLCITIFLPELPIRLIGVCISVLGALGYFMLTSQRIADSANYRLPNVSQRTDYSVIVKKDEEGKRTIFIEQDDETAGSSIDGIMDGQCRASEYVDGSSKTDDEDAKIKSAVSGFFKDGRSSAGPSKKKAASGQKSASVWIFSRQSSTAPRNPSRPVKASSRAVSSSTGSSRR